MAAEYEINELGFIGSFWFGSFGDPKKIGRTIQVSNIPAVVELRGVVGDLSTSRARIHFTEMNKFSLQEDIAKLNSYLSDDYYFEVGYLPPNIIEEIAVRMKIDRNFLRDNNNVLFRYNKNSSTKNDPNFSKFPVQPNWQFDSSTPTKPKILFNDPLQTPHISFSFIVGLGLIDTFTQYFSSIEDTQTELLSAGANPYNTPRFNRDVQGRILDPRVRTIPPRPEIAIIGLSDVTGEAPTPGVLFSDTIGLPPSPPEPKVYVFPAVDADAASEERASKLFAVNKSTHIIASIAEFNEELIQCRIRRGELATLLQNRQNVDGTTDVPFTERNSFEIMVQHKYWGYVETYLYEQIANMYNVELPTVNPSRWEVTDDGNINILPPPVETPREIINVAVEDRKDLADFDSFVDEMIDDLTIDDNNIYVFKKITKVADYDLPVLRYKTKGLFRCTGEKLSTFHTGSLTPKQQKYYLTVFNEKQYTDESYHQFDITYCHISGSGSSHIENEIDLYPSKAMYRKYMLECFGHTNGKFPFKNGKNGDYFYAIQLDRSQFKEKLDAGNFELALCELSSSGNEVHQTSTRFFTLIDDSKDSKQQIVTNEGIQEYYYITSGSIRDGIYNEPEDDAWGIVFPKMGLIILDGVVMDQSCSFNTITGSTDGQNSKRLFLSISGAAVPTPYRPSGSFFARSFETYLTETYFCRADFNEFNTSTNYTYTTGSNGFLKYDYFAKEPQSFISTIGLYNKEKQLLAVGKLRNPIRKNDGKVCIFEVVVRLN